MMTMAFIHMFTRILIQLQCTIALCNAVLVEPGTDTCNLRVLPAGVLGLQFRGEPGEESDAGPGLRVVKSYHCL